MADDNNFWDSVDAADAYLASMPSVYRPETDPNSPLFEFGLSGTAADEAANNNKISAAVMEANYARSTSDSNNNSFWSNFGKAIIGPSLNPISNPPINRTTITPSRAGTWYNRLLYPNASYAGYNGGTLPYYNQSGNNSWLVIGAILVVMGFLALVFVRR